MYRWLPIILIFLNFWGVFILNKIFATEWYLIPVNNYTDRVFEELLVISVVLLFFIVCSPKLKRQHREKKKYLIKNTYIFWILFSFFFILYFVKINFSLDNTLRGVGQFEIENRAGFIESVSGFSIPFILFSLYYKVFGKSTNRLVILLCLVMILSGITNGGRKLVSYLFISLALYFFYFQNIKIKTIIKYGILGAGLLTFAMIARNINSPVENFQFEFLFSLLQANSDPSILWMVKELETQGFHLSPWIFLNHFWSILIPSFIYSRITGQISYTRATFYFDRLFNTNPDMGYDFMVLADFYWCFGYIGYLLFIFFIILIFRYFRKHIYDINGYKAIASIIMIMYLCQQRNDFGAILKPIVYSYLFLWVLNKISNPRIIDDK